MPISGALKLALLAEGAGEVAHAAAFRVEPGALLPSDQLGAAHILVRRMVAAWGIPEGAITFVRPLRLHGRDPRGSDLTHPGSLRKLVNWPVQQRSPHASLVLVDEDAESARLTTMRTGLGTSNPPSVIAVAGPEFEAWLLADHGALQATLRATIPLGPSPDSLAPGACKQLLAHLCAMHRPDADASVIRASLAGTLDIATAVQRSSSLKRLNDDLRALLQRLNT